MLLVGDIGGTKTLLALFAPESDARTPLFEREYPSADHPCLEAIVRHFLDETGQTAEFGCFDVAGPVLQGQATITNLPWRMDEAGLARSLGLKQVMLLNDLKAIAYAIPFLRPEDYRTLSPGEPDRQGPIAIVAPGTGLGEAFLIWSEDRYVPCASEGGHASFAPSNEHEVGLWRHVRQQFETVSFERVCSGPGIATIYDFLRTENPDREAPTLAAALATAGDRTPLIARAGLDGDPLAAAALNMFVDILGAEAGNLALKIMATGGVYLAGGVPTHLLPLLQEARFMSAFAHKGRLGPVLQRMPVHVVTIRAALLGAAQFGLDQLRTQSIA